MLSLLPKSSAFFVNTALSTLSAQLLQRLRPGASRAKEAEVSLGNMLGTLPVLHKNPLKVLKLNVTDQSLAPFHSTMQGNFTF